MAGSTFGTLFKITTWGESHGQGLGVVVDGCPAGLPLCEADIQTFLNRRKPGQNKFSTPRKEADQVEILSGVFDGQTTGTPISLLVRNQNQISRDYGNLAEIYRPGHADYTFHEKYGIRDFRGGGRSSGRETIGRVAAGAIACKILNNLGITFTTYTKTIGPVSVPQSEYHYNEINENPLYMPNNALASEASIYLEQCMKKQDSAGGIIECIISGLPAGIGEPVFDKLDAVLAHAIFSIGSVKGFEIGDGFQAAALKGSENNDAFHCSNNKITKQSNHAGGVLGGISDGSDLIFRAAIKPTPSISSEQQTVTRTGENTTIQIHGRHDPVIVPRAVVVVESMAALSILDLLMQNLPSRLSNLIDFYQQ